MISPQNRIYRRYRKFVAQEIQDPGTMKMNNFKKWCDCAAVVKVKPTIELKMGEKKNQAEKSKMQEWMN